LRLSIVIRELNGDGVLSLNQGNGHVMFSQLDIHLDSRFMYVVLRHLQHQIRNLKNTSADTKALLVAYDDEVN